MNRPNPPAPRPSRWPLRGPVLLWGVSLLAMVSYASLSAPATTPNQPTGSQVDDAHATEASGAQFTAMDATSLRVELPESRATFELEDRGALRLVTVHTQGGALELSGPGPVVASDLLLTERDDGFVVDHGERSYRFKARDEGGYSVRNEAGTVLYRVKLKDDKFNVYDGQGTRLRAGKAKKGGISVRDDAGTEIGRIEGTEQLAVAAVLALPLPPAVLGAALAQRVESLL